MDLADGTGYFTSTVSDAAGQKICGFYGSSCLNKHRDFYWPGNIHDQRILLQRSTAAAHPTVSEDAVATKSSIEFKPDKSDERTTLVAGWGGFFAGVAMVFLGIFVKTRRSRETVNQEPLLA